MPKPKFPYAGDAALKRLLARYRCPAPFHVVRMRFWGEIVSPSLQASPIKTIESFWSNGLPAFEDGEEANAFFQALMSTPNEFAALHANAAPRHATGRDAAVHGASASRPVAQPPREGQMQQAEGAVSS